MQFIFKRKKPADFENQLHSPHRHVGSQTHHQQPQTMTMIVSFIFSIAIAVGMSNASYFPPTGNEQVPFCDDQVCSQF